MKAHIFLLMCSPMLRLATSPGCHGDVLRTAKTLADSLGRRILLLAGSHLLVTAVRHTSVHAECANFAAVSRLRNARLASPNPTLRLADPELGLMRGIDVSAATLQTIGTIFVAFIGVGGTSIAALMSYQTWQRKRQPVIAGIDDWREVVAAQKLWLENIETYIKILSSPGDEGAIQALRAHTWSLNYERERDRLQMLRAEAEDIKRKAPVKSAEYSAETGKTLGSGDPEIQRIIKQRASEIEKQETERANDLLNEVEKATRENESRHANLPYSGRLTGMFTEEPAPALLQLRQGRAAIAACRNFNSTIETLRIRMEQEQSPSGFLRAPVGFLRRRRSNAYLRSAISSLSSAQASLTEISYLNPDLLNGSTNGGEAGTAK